MQRPPIEIRCPNCALKAFYYSESITLNMNIVPGLKGKAICSHCGFNSHFEFSNKHYYYQILVGERILYARTLENLIALREYFKEGKKTSGDPDEDFPKIFYQNRDKIIKEIDKIVEEQTR